MLFRSSNAIQAADHASRLAEKNENPALAEAIGARLELYKAGRPFRDKGTAGEKR